MLLCVCVVIGALGTRFAVRAERISLYVLPTGRGQLSRCRTQHAIHAPIREPLRRSNPHLLAGRCAIRRRSPRWDRRSHNHRRKRRDTRPPPLKNQHHHRRNTLDPRRAGDPEKYPKGRNRGRAQGIPFATSERPSNEARGPSDQTRAPVPPFTRVGGVADSRRKIA